MTGNGAGCSLQRAGKVARMAEAPKTGRGAPADRGESVEAADDAIDEPALLPDPPALEPDGRPRRAAKTPRRGDLEPARQAGVRAGPATVLTRGRLRLGKGGQRGKAAERQALRRGEVRRENGAADCEQGREAAERAGSAKAGHGDEVRQSG